MCVRVSKRERERERERERQTAKQMHEQHYQYCVQPSVSQQSYIITVMIEDSTDDGVLRNISIRGGEIDGRGE